MGDAIDQPKLSEAVIAKSLVRFGGMFPPRRYLCVENVSWGLLPWEADLLCMSGSGLLQEVEIKISVADLRRDLEKDKHRLRHEAVVVGGRASPPSSEATAERRVNAIENHAVCYICGRQAFTSVNVLIGAANGGALMRPVCDAHNPYAPPLGSPGADVEKAAREILRFLNEYAGSHIAQPHPSEIAAILKKHVGQPKDWVLVPREPTEAMLRWMHRNSNLSHEGCLAAWHQALAASPPLAQEGDKP